MTVRMVKSSLAPNFLLPAISNLVTLDELCNQFVKGLAGFTLGPNIMSLRSFMKNNNSPHTYFIHISTVSSATINRSID